MDDPLVLGALHRELVWSLYTMTHLLEPETKPILTFLIFRIFRTGVRIVTSWWPMMFCRLVRELLWRIGWWYYLFGRGTKQCCIPLFSQDREMAHLYHKRMWKYYVRQLPGEIRRSLSRGDMKEMRLHRINQRRLLDVVELCAKKHHEPILGHGLAFLNDNHDYARYLEMRVDARDREFITH